MDLIEEMSKYTSANPTDEGCWVCGRVGSISCMCIECAARAMGLMSKIRTEIVRLRGIEHHAAIGMQIDFARRIVGGGSEGEKVLFSSDSGVEWEVFDCGGDTGCTVIRRAAYSPAVGEQVPAVDLHVPADLCRLIGHALAWRSVSAERAMRKGGAG